MFSLVSKAEFKKIRNWENEFDVESPNQLRGTLADESLDTEEEDRRREIACEWDFLAPTEPAEASS